MYLFTFLYVAQFKQKYNVRNCWIFGDLFFVGRFGYWIIEQKPNGAVYEDEQITGSLNRSRMEQCTRMNKLLDH